MTASRVYLKLASLAQQKVEQSDIRLDGYPLHSGSHYRLWFRGANKIRKVLLCCLVISGWASAKELAGDSLREARVITESVAEESLAPRLETILIPNGATSPQIRLSGVENRPPFLRSDTADAARSLPRLLLRKDRLFCNSPSDLIHLAVWRSGGISSNLQFSLRRQDGAGGLAVILDGVREAKTTWKWYVRRFIYAIWDKFHVFNQEPRTFCVYNGLSVKFSRSCLDNSENSNYERSENQNSVDPETPEYVIWVVIRGGGLFMSGFLLLLITVSCNCSRKLYLTLLICWACIMVGGAGFILYGEWRTYERMNERQQHGQYQQFHGDEILTQLSDYKGFRQ